VGEEEEEGKLIVEAVSKTHWEGEGFAKRVPVCQRSVAGGHTHRLGKGEEGCDICKKYIFKVTSRRTSLRRRSFLSLIAGRTGISLELRREGRAALQCRKLGRDGKDIRITKGVSRAKSGPVM